MRGAETILVVDDEPAILAMITSALERRDYTVLPSNGPDEALAIAQPSIADPIDLC